MIWVVVGLYVAATAPTAADLGRCVQRNAREIAAGQGFPPALAEKAVMRCHSMIDQLSRQRDAQAAVYTINPAERQKNSVAWRESLTRIMTDMAQATIEDRRNGR